MSQIRGRLYTHHLTIYLVAVIACSLDAVAIASAQDSARVPTVTLLKRIADAVDGLRLGRNVFVVTSADSMTVTAVLPSRPDAEALLARLDPRYDLHGPYRGDIDLGPIDHILPADCVHDGLSAFKPRAICPPRKIDESFGNLTCVL